VKEQAGALAVFIGKTTIVLSLLAVGSFSFSEFILSKFQICERPLWLEDSVRWMGALLILFTFIAGALSMLLGLIWKRYAVTLGLAGISILIIFFLAAFLLLMNRGENFNGECTARSHMRTINTAEVSYAAGHGGRFGTMADLVEAGLLDVRFGGEYPVNGYTYSVSITPDNYVATAKRAASNCSARWDFFTLRDAVIRYSTNADHAPRNQAGNPVE
jgi:hypothetical protein